MAIGMYHLDDLEIMIKRSFSDLMKKANLSFVSGCHNDIDEFRLFNNKCILRFRYDCGQISCMIISSLTKRIYYAEQVYEALHPDKNEYPFSLDIPPQTQIARYAQMIESRLMNVLEGDFSWENRIKSW